MPVAQRFFLSKMVPVFWCRFLPNCNMLFDCRISKIRTFPAGMTPSGLPCPFLSFPKIQNFFRFLRLPIFGSPQIKNPEGCPTTTRKGNVFPLQKLQPCNLPAITSRNPHHYGPLTPVASALIPLPSDSV